MTLYELIVNYLYPEQEIFVSLYDGLAKIPCDKEVYSGEARNMPIYMTLWPVFRVSTDVDERLHIQAYIDNEVD